MHSSQRGFAALPSTLLAAMEGPTAGVMIARGDLAVECGYERLAEVQEEMLWACEAAHLPVVWATQVLETLARTGRPSRAEITDVANAVFEQADAIMLSGETTVGKYPVECVKILDRVARRIAQSGGAGYAKEAVVDTTRLKTVRSAVSLANSFPNAHIVVFTRRGYMAEHASHLRPENAPIYAFSPSLDVVRRLALHWNTHPIQMTSGINPEHTIADAEAELERRGLIKKGDQLIILSDVMAGNERFDSIQLRQVF